MSCPDLPGHIRREFPNLFRAAWAQASGLEAEPGRGRATVPRCGRAWDGTAFDLPEEGLAGQVARRLFGKQPPEHAMQVAASAGHCLDR